MGKVEERLEALMQAIEEERQIENHLSVIHYGVDALKSKPNEFTFKRFNSVMVEFVKLSALGYDNQELMNQFTDLYSHHIKSTLPKKKSGIRSGYVYVICDYERTGEYKIGRSKNWEKRLQKFEVKLPFKFYVVTVIPCQDMFKAERQLHKQYADKRTNGEWFACADEDIEEIKKIERL